MKTNAAIMAVGLLLLTCGPLMADWKDSETPLETMRRLVTWRQWEKASKLLEKVEKQGLCRGAVCLAGRALLADGRGEVEEAGRLARQAAKQFGGEHELSAWELNELGVLLYRAAAGEAATLGEAESAFRLARDGDDGSASNIRFNLAIVLQALGRVQEGKTMMAQVEADGLVIQPGMSILADFQMPGRQR